MKKFLLWPFFLLLIINTLPAQKIADKLSAYRKKFPSEKIYIQYNKEYFLAGETIWFKAYLTINHAPGGLTNNFYLQLSDDKGKIISNIKYPVNGATVSGNMDIPDSIAGGVYTIKAFTPVMLSPDAESIYSKAIHVYNPNDKKGNESFHNPGTADYSIQFFPEGGNLVADINTVIAFKAVDKNGYPVDVKGHIQTDDSLMLIAFSSYHDGIGQFQLTPQAGKQYIAIAEINGQQSRFSLPIVQTTGLALRVGDETGAKTFIISRNGYEKLNADTFKVVIQMNNTVVYEKEFCFGDHLSAGGLLNTDSLPTGILHFTVFNHDDAPLLERLSFVNNYEYKAGATLSVPQLGIKPRELNSLVFDFPDTAQRSCSVAITDYEDDEPVNRENIISHLLLTSDLKGEIYNPGYYFSEQNDSVKKAMDNLMLTHGWRRFNWKKILHDEYREPQTEDEYLINISGTIMNSNTKESVTGGVLNIFISAEDSTLLSYNFPVSEKGRFLLDSLFFSGKTRIYYSYTDKKGKQKPVTIFPDEKKHRDWSAELSGKDRVEKPVFSRDIYVNKETSDLSNITFIHKDFENAKELENVVVISKGKRPVDILNEKYTTELYRTGSRYIIDNITRPEVLAGGSRGAVKNFIAHRLPRVGIYRGALVNIIKNGSFIAVFINESPASYLELEQLRIEQIAIVKFWDNDPALVSSEYGGGTIAIYTKKNEDISYYKSKPANTPYFMYDGYSIEKEFYSPDYSISPDKNNDRDRRTTLCWNPKLYTNAGENRIRVNFYNNDVSRKFKIVLEGFDNKGRLIFLEKTIGDGLQP